VTCNDHTGAGPGQKLSDTRRTVMPSPSRVSLRCDFIVNHHDNQLRNLEIARRCKKMNEDASITSSHCFCESPLLEQEIEDMKSVNSVGAQLWIWRIYKEDRRIGSYCW